MEQSLIEVNEKAQKIEVEVKRLKIEVLEAKSIRITDFRKPKAYKFDFIEIVALFLAKKNIKMEGLLWRHH